MEKISSFLNRSISISESFSLTPKALLLLIAIFLLTYLSLKVFKKIIYRTLSTEAKVKFKSIFTFINYFIYVVVILIALDNIGVNVTAIFAASAALLVGVGLALQTFIQDIISGIFIIADQAVHVGDIIEVDGQVGKVENITLRTTRAVTRENKVLIIPNHKFLTSILFNWTENGVVTKEFISVGVAYGSDVMEVKQLLLHCASSHKAVLKQPAPFVLFDDYGDSALMFKIYFSIKESFVSNMVKSDIRYTIFESFNENNINIPFPQRTISYLNPQNPKA